MKEIGSIPRSWHAVSLTEACELVTDGTHHSPPNIDRGDFPYITAKNIRPWGLDTTDLTYVSAEVHAEIFARCPVEFEDVLYIKDGVTTGLAAVNHLHEPFSLLSSVALLKPRRDLLNPYFLKHWLNSPATYRALTANMTGTAIRRLVLNQIRAAEICLPPLNEQRRIVAKIEELTAHSRRAREALNAVPTLLERFRQSVLSAAFRGDLTAEWRRSHDITKATTNLPPGWTMARVGDLGSLRLGKMLDKTKNRGLPAKYLRNINVRWFSFDLSDVQSILVSEDERAALSIRNGDLLICEGGEPGRCATWAGGDTDLVFQKALHRFRANPTVHPEWLMFRLRFDASSGTLGEAFTGTTIKHLTGESLSRYEVPVAPIEEQRVIIKKIYEIFAALERLEPVVQENLSRLSLFEQAILAKAFRGELLPQDPNDEPASVLLERIRGERADSILPKAKRGRKPRELAEAKG